MKTPLGREVDLDPCHIVLDGDPAPRAKAAQQPPSFRPMFIVATVVHISYCFIKNVDIHIDETIKCKKCGDIGVNLGENWVGDEDEWNGEGQSYIARMEMIRPVRSK